MLQCFCRVVLLLVGHVIHASHDLVKEVGSVMAFNHRVEGTSVEEIVKTEPSSNIEKFEVLGRANTALCFKSKSF